MGATGAGRGELGRPGRGLTKSGKVADNDWPLGVGVCIDLIVFLVVEHRDGIAGEDHGHRQGDGYPEAAFIFFCFGFGAHFGLPFVRFTGVCRFVIIIAGTVPILIFARFQPFFS